MRMMSLVLSIVHLFVQTTAALECFSCQAINDVNICNNTMVCKDGQACFLNTSSTNKHHMNVLGCIDNQQCTVHGDIPATLVGRDLYTRQTTGCLECCSSDHCNKNLCEHLKPQSCIDDDSFDCARLNSLFNICNDISQAKKVCPKFCNLCNVVDGNWTPWSAWSSCDVTCEKGLKTRTRSCTNPAPQHGGQMCLGNSTDSKVCELDLCPIHGGWGQWQEWGLCSVTCDMGMKSRSRDCSNPPPSRFGDHCFGHNQESQLCMPKICSNGGWSAWEMWGSCSVTCGNGIKSRFRSCTSPKPSPYGQYCEGHHSEIYSCSQISCDLSHCQPDPCVHGSCIDLRNDFLCTCDQGFEGRNCNISNSMCKSNPCVHGTCFDNKDGFVCSCAAGFKGKYCNTNIDECISNPCGLGGTCHDAMNGYNCVCAPGFSGVNCETDIDDCLIGLCGTYGTCIDGINNYTCACETGYTGNNCEINKDDCLIGLCGTYGTCIDGIDNYTCACETGFTGNNCKINVDDCLIGLCGTYGTCIDGINNYTCACKTGFTGNNCEINIDECISNPCGFGGTCYDTMNGYKCVCAPGFSGLNCEKDIDDCLIGLCGPYGTCIDGINNYTCACETGFTGNNCEINIDECVSNPCGFDGTCYDTMNGYNCVCAPGFSGLNCKIDIDDCLIGLCGPYGTCIDGINNYTCACETGFTGNNCEIRLQTDCSDIKHENVNAPNGVYNVTTWNTHRTIQVYCDMTTAGGGWTVFQNRVDGSVNFTRNFSEYVNGFGDIHKEFWLGLENIHELVSQGNYELRIDVTAANGSKGYETFPNFTISAGSNYTLHISPGSGSLGDTTGDGLSYHNNEPFSTFDHGHDSDCAIKYKSGWWYDGCMTVHLNGVYLLPGTIDNFQGIFYRQFYTGYHSLRTSRMMFRKT